MHEGDQASTAVTKPVPYKASKLLYVPPGINNQKLNMVLNCVNIFYTDLRTDSDFCLTKY